MSGQDLRLEADANGVFDIQIDGSDFQADEGLQTALEVSLLTDARSANVADRGSRRGYAGDVFLAPLGRSLGSTLWEYDQARLTPRTINGIRAAANNALAYLAQDNIARSVTATVSNPASGLLRVDIDILTNEGDIQQYEVLWRQTV